jgi:predicted dinucleotide-binding enzyme
MARPAVADSGEDGAMRIAIIGAGNVGGGLGKALSQVGHEVVFGVRDPDSTKTQAALADVGEATATTPSEAVDGADVIVVALRPVAIGATVRDLPPLDDRIVIDSMNRFDGEPGRSTTDDLADLLPGAKLAKAFNTIGFENLSTARNREVPAAMFVAADDPDAKRLAMLLAQEIGFQPEDAGGLANAYPLEQMVKVWLALSQAHGRTVGFAITDG